MATLEAMLAPKQFSGRGKDPEQLLIDFDLYINTVNNLLNWPYFQILDCPCGKVCRLKNSLLKVGYCTGNGTCTNINTNIDEQFNCNSSLRQKTTFNCYLEDTITDNSIVHHRKNENISNGKTTSVSVFIESNHC